MSAKGKIKYNLDSGKFCANCLGKMAGLRINEGEGLHCPCYHCQNNNFARCSRCHIVPYCSKQCQIEHWRYHKKICKKLEGKAIETPPPCMKYTVQMFCHAFQTNGFNLSSFIAPTALPFPFEWYDRQLIGWIEEYLVYLASMATRLLGTWMKTLFYEIYYIRLCWWG